MEFISNLTFIIKELLKFGFAVTKKKEFPSLFFCSGFEIRRIPRESGNAKLKAYYKVERVKMEETKEYCVVSISDINKDVEHELDETTYLVVKIGKVLIINYKEQGDELVFKSARNKFNIANEIVKIIDILMQEYNIHDIELDNYYWDQYSNKAKCVMNWGFED